VITEPEPLCVDRAGLGKMLLLSRRELYRLEDAGRLPAPIVLGTCKRWSIEEVQEWVRAGAPPRRVWQNLRSAASPPRQCEAGLR
jgi:predicted DNA-binding transcriptional regulator AlpA